MGVQSVQSLSGAQTHVHQVGDAIQPSHPLSSPSPPAYSLSQHQGLFQRVSSSHQVAKVLASQGLGELKWAHGGTCKNNNKSKLIWDFPVSPGAKTSHFHCRVGGFDPWSGN